STRSVNARTAAALPHHTNNPNNNPHDDPLEANGIAMSSLNPIQTPSIQSNGNCYPMKAAPQTVNVPPPPPPQSRPAVVPALCPVGRPVRRLFASRVPTPSREST